MIQEGGISVVVPDIDGNVYGIKIGGVERRFNKAHMHATFVKYSCHHEHYVVYHVAIRQKVQKRSQRFACLLWRGVNDFMRARLRVLKNILGAEMPTCERKMLKSSTIFCVHVETIVEEWRGDGKSCISAR